MFPQIAKKKKKEFTVEETVTKQLEDALRDLEIRSKAALKRIPNHVLHDFGKVCRVKSIPEFYANYFITATCRVDPQKLQQVYANEIEYILTNSSNFHKINQALRQRQQLIQGLKNSLVIVEGFLLMNQNKAVSLQIKTSIDGMVSECATLEELKDLQRRKTEELAKDIIRVRTNTTQLVQLVQEWRKELERLGSDNVKKMGIIYPHQAINCMLMPLYDLLFLRASSLKSQISFGKDEHDPFLERISKNKKGTQIQNYLLDYLKADTTDYSQYTKAILDEFPSDQAERLKEKELQLQQKKADRALQQKIKQQQLKSMRQERDKNVRIRHYSSLKSLKEGSAEGRSVAIKSSKGGRSDRKIINVDRLIRQTSKKRNSNQPHTQNDSKILGVYKKSKKIAMQHSALIDKQELIQEKRIWQKSMKEEKQEKEKIRKQLRQTQKRALQQNKQFQLKLKRYEQEVHNLESRIQQSKKQSRVSSSKPVPTSPAKARKEMVISAYKSQRSGAGNSSTSMLQSKLQEQTKNKRHLQRQIKQMGQEKQKLQKIINRQNVRASKEVSGSRRQMQKYEQVISKLKNESDESLRIIQQLQLSKISEQNKKNETIRNSKIRQREQDFKQAIQNRMDENDRIVKAYQQKKKESLPKNQSKQRHSLATSRSNQNTSQIRSNDPDVQLLKSRLEQESRAKLSLQSQIRELQQQKSKLQRLIQKQSFRSAKEQDRNSRKIEKYEQMINKLKKQSEDTRRAINQIQFSKVAEQKKELQRSKVQLVKKREEQLKRKIQQKIQQRQRRKATQRSKVEQSRRKQLNRSSSIIQQEADDVQIIKTKQTIQIVFQPRRKRAHPSKELIQAESKLVKLQKERQLLEKKLQLSITDKKQKVQQTRMRHNQAQMSDKFKGQIQKQRAKNQRLEQNIKKMRASISNEYQVRLNQQKVKYERDREELLKQIQRQREQKRTKDRILQQQMNFLKQMQKKENELFELLQNEKREKSRKQLILAKEIQEKEQLMNMIELDEIKKNIEREVRKQIQETGSEDEEDYEQQQRKAELEQEIEQLRLEKEQEIQEMDGQNQKLRELIAELKAEQTQLLEAIKQNIEMDSEQEKQQNNQGEEQPKPQTSEPVTHLTLEELQEKNQKLAKELESKTIIQFRNEDKHKQQISRIKNSQDFHERQKIQNLVEYYLRSPSEYSGQSPTKLKPTEKKEIIETSVEKARMIQQFHNELFSLKELPDFVPTIKNDSINSHLLNLREVYQDYEADSLRRQLFPPLQEQVYGGKELSEDDSEPPMNTIMDEVRAHQTKHAQKSDKGKKNFLAINRVRLAVLEDVRKEKQRQIIEQQSKKRIQRELFEKRRKQRQQNYIQERQKEHQLKEQKREELYRKEKERLSNQKKQQQRSKQKRRREDGKRKKSQMSDKQQKYQSEKQHKKSRRKGQNSSSDSEQSKSENEAEKIQKKHQNQPNMLPIKQEQTLKQQQAQLQQKVQQFQQQIKKRQKELLKSEIKQVQEQVRAYIKEQQQFTVYQQFINQSELITRIQQILDLSSQQIKSLNSNQTILEDVQLYPVLTVLVAKNNKGLQIGLGVFHKELQAGEYVCDYLIAHNMQNFLNLAFNFARFLFQNDPYAIKSQFIFDIKNTADTQTLKHFLEFQKKCRRLGQVYIKAKSQTERKYVLRRALFQPNQEKTLSENNGVFFNLNLSLCGNILTQINAGFKNTAKFNYSSFNLIFAYYLSRKQKKLQHFRVRAETQLIYRQLLVTGILFNKKQLQIKNFTLNQRSSKDLGNLLHLKDKFELNDVDQLDEMAMLLSQRLPQTAKRCTLQVGLQQVDYLLITPQQAITSIQSSNSSETGYFLSIIPKYKLMVIEAQEFLTMSAKNPDLTAFFYIKHFIKNIVDVKKAKQYERVYLPQVHIQNQFHFPDISKRLGETVFLAQNLHLGWKSNFPNSVLYTPRHQDLVIQKPFIVALLSGPVQRAVEGSPICVQVVL